jgi:hypothetical protein
MATSKAGTKSTSVKEAVTATAAKVASALETEAKKLEVGAMKRGAMLATSAGKGLRVKAKRLEGEATRPARRTASTAAAGAKPAKSATAKATTKSATAKKAKSATK